MKPKYLVAGYSIGHKPRPLYVNKWDVSQLKKLHFKYILPKEVSEDCHFRWFLLISLTLLFLRKEVDTCCPIFFFLQFLVAGGLEDIDF